MSVDDHERAVADDLAGHGTLRPDPAAPRGRPPVAVLTVVALLALLALLQAVVIVVILFPGAALWTLALLIFPAIPASVAYGLWHGWRGSQIASVVIGFMLLFAGAQSSDRFHLGVVMAAAGVAVAVLVVVPRSSRAWFGWPDRSGSPPPTP